MSKLLDEVRNSMRLAHYSYRTGESYVAWIKRFILYHNKRHPREMGASEIDVYLTHLANGKHVFVRFSPVSRTLTIA